MEGSAVKGLKGYLRQATQWFSETPERSLDRAYKAALTIKAIEDEHFGGRKIPTQSTEYGDNTLAYFQAEIKKYLKTAKFGLAEFKASRAIARVPESTKDINYYNIYSIESREKNGVILEKLNFIDQVIAKYTQKEKQRTSLIPVTPSKNVKLDTEINAANKLAERKDSADAKSAQNVETISDKTGILPRSILRTFQRLQRELDPAAETEVVENFRNAQYKTVVSLRFILLLILVPLLTHQIAKTFVVGPLVEHARESSSEIFINVDLEREALMELEEFEKELKFKQLVGWAPSLSENLLEEQIQEKAVEIKEEYFYRSSNAIKNIFSDIFSLLSFCILIVVSRKEIVIIKSFLDDIVYGLSDSAKAFIIILFTDIFVGYHSPHGWEVVLQAMGRHLGLPENRQFDFVFIATFPVILDTLLKYWIFRYLNRISPSAVATYRNMNE